MNIEPEPGHYVLALILFLCLIASLAIGALARFTSYLFIDRSFSPLDEMTKLCVVLVFVCWTIVSTYWIGKIYLEGRRR